MSPASRQSLFLLAALSQRPLPAPLDVPPNFAAAVERGTRTLDGRPGPRYWTNTADYALEARLLPEEKRLEGRARIVYPE